MARIRFTYPLIAPALVVLGSLGSPPVAVADPLPYGPDTCIQGFVWREASPSDHVCVTPNVRNDTAQQNAVGPSNREPNGGAYGPDTCKQGFVWRDAFPGDHVCVTSAARNQAAADNNAAGSRKQSNQKPPEPPKPPQGPGVNWSPVVGGLKAHINDRSGVASQCLYKSDFYERSFFLPANGAFDLMIVPAIPKFQNWNVTISCDNGAKTNTSTFF